MSKLSRFAVVGLVSCLTISQGALAQTRAHAAKPQKRAMVQKSSVKVAANQAPRSQSERMSSDSYSGGELTTQKPTRQKSLTGFAKTVLHPVPEGRQGIIGVDLATGKYDGTMSQSFPTGYGANLKLKREQTTQTSMVTLKGLYSFTDSFYTGAKLSYANSTTEAKISGESAGVVVGNGNTQKGTSKGISEPSVVGGFQTLSGNTRFLSELELQVPIGNATSKTSGNETESDGKSGGGSITPRLITVTDLRSLKLIGQIGYEIKGERKVDRTNSGSSTDTIQTTGGNQLTLSALTELPQAMNLAAGLQYGKSEDSKRDGSTLDNGVETATAILAAGIPISQKALITPILGYSTVLNKSAGDVTVESLNTWTFQLGTSIMF